MDDERIERALREGPPDEPAYLPGVTGRLGSDGREASRADTPLATDRPAGSPDLQVLRPDGVRLRRAGTQTRRSIPVTIAAALAIAVGGLLITQTIGPGPAAIPSPSLDLLARLRASGSVTIAVSNGAPQTVSAGGAHIGFDIDVADAIAMELGLGGRVSALATEDFATTDWDLALPGGTRAGRSGGIASDPYAYWPIWLATGSASPVTDLASLASARVCIVRGSTGAAWLAGEMTSDGPHVPAGASAVEAATDDDCVAAVTDGRADAMVTATLLADELEARGLSLVVPTPAASEPWSVVVDAPVADSATLLDAVNRVIADLRVSGRLEDISRSSFGGEDVSVRLP